MDWASIRVTLTLVAITMSACGGVSPRGRELGPFERATVPSVGQKVIGRTRNSLGYRAELLGTRLVTVELVNRFWLIVRDRPIDGGIPKEVRRIDLAKADFDILDLAVTADGSRAFVASAAGWVRSYDLNRGELQSEWRMGSSATSLALSPNDATLIIGTSSGVLCLRRLRDGAQLQCVVAHESRVSALDISGRTLASGDWSGAVALWSLPSLRALQRSSGNGFISDIAWSDDGAKLAIARNRRRPVRTPELNHRETSSAKVDEPGHNQIEVIAPGTKSEPLVLNGHRSVISSLAWLGTDLLSTSWDRTVRIWNTRKPDEVRILLKTPHLSSSVAVYEGNGEVAIASWAVAADDVTVTWLRLLYPSE